MSAEAFWPSALNNGSGSGASPKQPVASGWRTRTAAFPSQKHRLQEPNRTCKHSVRVLTPGMHKALCGEGSL